MIGAGVCLNFEEGTGRYLRMSDFRRLNVWRKAHELALDTFNTCAHMRGFPASLVRNQLLRSVLSVPANIAEGSAKQSDPEYARFLRIALGSLAESEYHLILAGELELITANQAQSLMEQLVDVRKMLSGLVKTLKSGQPRAQREHDSAGRTQQAAGSSEDIT
jgi:four helix bundle protein